MEMVPKYMQSYSFVKGFAHGLEYKNLMVSLSVCEKYHEGQKRKGNGDPYIVHPLKVCTYLISLGIKDDIILSAALLHDVIEDGELDFNGKELAFYDISQEVIDLTLKLTKVKGADETQYYKNIEEDYGAVLIKLADRSHNLSTMLGAFNKEKMLQYIEETEKYVLPLIRYAKKHYPTINNQVTIMKYQIKTLCDVINGLLTIE